MIECTPLQELVKSSTVKILDANGNFLGTGFFVTPRKIATCYHVFNFSGGMPGFQLEGYPGIFTLKDNFLPSPQVDTLVIDLGQPFSEICINLASRPNRSKDELWGWSFNEAYLKGAEISAPIRGAANHQNREVIRMARDIVEQGSSGTPMLNLRTHSYAGLTYWAKNADALVIPADAFEEHFPGVFEENQKHHRETGYWRRVLEAAAGSATPTKPVDLGFVLKPKPGILRGLLRAFPFLDLSATYFKPLAYHSLGIDKKSLQETFRYYVVPSDYLFDGRAQLARKLAPKKRRALADKWSKDLTALFLEGFLHQENSYVLLLGDAGVGKTTFLQKVFLDYARKYPSTALAFVYAGEDTAVRIEVVPDKANTVLFLDALDEDPLARQDLDRCLDRLSPLLASFQKVFISSRVQFFRKQEEEWKHLQGRIDLSIVELHEFREPEARTYLENKYRDQPGLRAKALDLFQRSRHFFKRPLLLSWFDELLVSEKIHFDYLFEVYETIAAAWAEREGAVVEAKNPQHRSYPEKLLAFSKDMAHHLFQEDLRTFNQTPIRQTAPGAGIVEIDASSRSFLTRDRANDTFTFTHQSFLDYFLAVCLFEGVIREEDFPFAHYPETDAFFEEMCWSRYAGLEKRPRNRDNDDRVELDDDHSLGKYAGNELAPLLPNRAFRALLLKYAGRLAEFKEAPYWHRLAGFLLPFCQTGPEQGHYIFRDYEDFQKSLEQPLNVADTGRFYLDHFSAEAAFEAACPDFQRKEIRLIAPSGAYKDFDFGKILARVAHNPVVWTRFSQCTSWHSEGFRLEDTSFLKHLSPQLETLELPDCGLTHVPSEILRFNNLRRLQLAHNRIEGPASALKPLLEMPELRYLNLYENPVSPVCPGPEADCLRALREEVLSPPEMIPLPGGFFYMGQPNPDIIKYKKGQKVIRSNDEQPVHRVKLSGFLIGKYQVTLGEFRQFIEQADYVTEAEKENKGSYIWDPEKKDWELQPGVNWRHDVHGELQDNDRHPVIHVSWDDATAYCAWLSERQGQVYRLPTEAEWEYAAKGGPHGGGYELDIIPNLREIAWFDENSDGHTHPVGQKEANTLGICDLIGNVWEWCGDWHAEDYYSVCDADPKGYVEDPAGPLGGALRVYRGGCWLAVAQGCRPSGRNLLTPLYRDFNLGFRLVSPLQAGGQSGPAYL